MDFGWSASRELYPVYSLLLPVFFLCGVAWILIALTVWLRRNRAPGQSAIAALYGFSVCLVALVVLLFNIPLVFDGGAKLLDPASNATPYFTDYATFETFKATYAHAVPSINDADLRKTYEKIRVDRALFVRGQAVKETATSAFMLVLAVSLFWFHWRWLRRMYRA